MLRTAIVPFTAQIPNKILLKTTSSHSKFFMGVSWDESIAFVEFKWRLPKKVDLPQDNYGSSRYFLSYDYILL